MKRLFACVVLLGAIGCSSEDGPPPPTVSSSRSNAILAPTGKTSATTTTGPSAKPTTTAVAAPRELCAGQKERQGPKGQLKVKGAPGAAELPKTIAFGAGKWVWLNFWAAWCGPCKEEMPRLAKWSDKLRAAGVLMDLAFVSIDDDERQLERFLETQPKEGGVRASYWLPEGGLRAGFLGSIQVKEAPQLPVQAIVSPSGMLACLIEGAVEDGDYAGLAKFLGAK